MQITPATSSLSSGSLAVIEHQCGNLAKRILLGNLRVWRPDILFNELALELLLDGDNTHLAGIWAGNGADDFHFWKPLCLCWGKYNFSKRLLNEAL